MGMPVILINFRALIRARPHCLETHDRNALPLSTRLIMKSGLLPKSLSQQSHEHQEK